MLKNYLKIALRNLGKRKTPTLVNVAGLALGIACCLLLFLFIEREWSYDRFHENADRIYRVVSTQTVLSGDVNHTSNVQFLLGAEFRASFPEVEDVVRLTRKSLRVRSARLTEEQEQVEFADASLFEVFTFPLAQGDPQRALATPDNVVLSEATARKYFGDADPMGQSLEIELNTGVHAFTVAGILQAVPAPSSLTFHVLLPFEQLPNTYSAWLRPVLASWDVLFPVANTYVRLHEAAQVSALAAKLPAFVDAHYGEKAEQVRLQLQPLADVHLSPEMSDGLEPASDPLYSYLLAGIALLVLGIACINFVTLMVARSVDRAQEVGLRKVVGAHRRQIRHQFWGEAILTTGLALGLGLALAELFLPTFNTLAGQSLSLGLLQRPTVWLAAAGLVLVIGLLAGAYPAVVLSRFEPVSVLKGHIGDGERQWFTRALVTIQFAFSIALVCGTLIMSDQLDYLLEKNLGFNPERVVVLNMSGTEDSERIYETLKQEVGRHTAVETVTGGYFYFGKTGIDIEMQVGDAPLVTAHMNPVDINYVGMMGLTLVRGHDFTAGNSREVLVNETFVRAFGWDDPLGKTLPVAEEATFAEIVEGMTIAGVVKDYHMESLHEPIKPLILASRAAMGNHVTAVLVRAKPGADAAALAVLEETWHRIAPDKPFRYEFLEDAIARPYKAEQRWRAIVGYASAFALLIACFGLFGLAALAAAHRTKEIGIRKVLGASVAGLMTLLCRDFLKLVLVASILAAPLAYVGLDHWLATFAYRIDLSPGVFVLAGLSVLAVALSTVSYYALRAALADPVKSLRYE